MSKSKQNAKTGTKAPKHGHASDAERKAAVAEAQAADAAANAEAVPGAGAGALPPASKTNKAKGKKGAPKVKKAPKPPKEKKVSLLDAAAKVLAASGGPMNCKAMVEAVTAKGLWSSPKGKTPHATLYSAILREVKDKGKDARFKKTDRGLFVANA